MENKKYAVIRCEKIKSFAASAALDRHNQRLNTVENADPNLKNLNINFGPPGELNTILKKRLTEIETINKKITRKDAVIAQDFLLSFSKDAINPSQVTDWARQSISFIENKYGKENVMQAILHLDEQTPHLHVVICPVKNNRLTAKTLFTKYTLRNLQTEYAQSVANFGLVRGEQNSKANHSSLTDFYKLVGKNESAIEVGVSLTERIKLLEEQLVTKQKEIEKKDEILSQYNGNVKLALQQIGILEAGIAKLQGELTQTQSTLSQAKTSLTQTSKEVTVKKTELIKLSEQLLKIKLALQR